VRHIAEPSGRTGAREAPAYLTSDRCDPTSAWWHHHLDRIRRHGPPNPLGAEGHWRLIAACVGSAHVHGT